MQGFAFREINAIGISYVLKGNGPNPGLVIELELPFESIIKAPVHPTPRRRRRGKYKGLWHFILQRLGPYYLNLN